MSDHEIDTLVAATDPLDEAALAAIDDATLRDLRDALLRQGADVGGVAERAPAEATRGARLARRRGRGPGAPARVTRGPRLTPRSGGSAVPARAGRRVRRRVPTRRLLAGVAVAAVAAVVVFAVVLREPGDSGTAWAAPLVRLAESSPLLLVGEPDWSVSRADETDAVEGEMTFTHGAPVDLNSATARSGHTADLHWRRGALRDWQRDRANDAALVVHRTVLGQPAQISQYREYRGIKDFTAIWPEPGGKRVLEFRAVADDLAAFERLVGSLKRVDVDAWLSAMPASVVKSGDRAAAVREMLADIPQPPGFDPSRLETDAKLSDRYQLGAQVTGAVGCAWIARWDAARRRGDDATVRQAIAAMQTSRRWKILADMKRDGAWTEVFVEFADAMKGDGTWFKRPLAEEARSGLGCDGG